MQSDSYIYVFMVSDSWGWQCMGEMSSFGVTEQSEASGTRKLSNTTKISQQVSENWDLRFSGQRSYVNGEATDRFFQNIAEHLPDNMMSQPARHVCYWLIPSNGSNLL